MNIAKATFNALETMVVPDGTLTDTDKATKQRKEKRTDAVKKVVKSARKTSSSDSKKKPKPVKSEANKVKAERNDNKAE